MTSYEGLSLWFRVSWWALPESRHETSWAYNYVGTMEEVAGKLVAARREGGRRKHMCFVFVIWISYAGRELLCRRKFRQRV